MVSADIPALCFEGLSHRYGKTPSVRDISFAIRRGEVVCLLGPSGCGKTTLLRLASGLEVPERGKIFINGQCVASGKNSAPPEDRPISMVFQDYALFPHLTVLRNVIFGLNKLAEREKAEIGEEVLERVGLSFAKDRYPHTLSGGQQQRVALARAMALRPQLMLMDEPFSNLDINLRFSVREETREILQSLGAATLLVTHDGEEAAQLADRILLLNKGKIVQEGSPEDFYFAPSSPFAARFFGETISIPGKREKGMVRSEIGEWANTDCDDEGEVEVVIRDQAFLFREPHGNRKDHLQLMVKILESRVMGGRRVTEFVLASATSSSRHYRAFHSMTTTIQPNEIRPCWFDTRLAFVFRKA